MAGFTDLTVYVGGPGVNLKKLRESIRNQVEVEKQGLNHDFEMSDDVIYLADILSHQESDYLSGYLLNLNSNDIEIVEEVLNQAITGDSNAYWRFATREHDDFDAEWWDSNGKREPWDPFRDLLD